MNDRCGSCHEAVGAADRFCKACGSPTGTLFAADAPDLLGRQPAEDQVVKAPRGRRLLGVLGLLLALGALAALIVLPSEDDTEDDEAADPTTPTERPTAEPTLTPTPEPTETPTPRPTPRPTFAPPTTRPTATPEPLFGSEIMTDAQLPAVPELGLGDHALVLAGETSMVAIDLRSGQRVTLHEWDQATQASHQSTFGPDGLFRAEGGQALFYPFDATGSVVVAEGAISLLRGIVAVFAEDASGGVVVHYRDGGQQYEVPLDFVDGITIVDGRPVASAGGTVFEAAAGEWNEVGPGSVIGTVGSGALVRRCRGAIECSVDLLNADLDLVRSLNWPGATELRTGSGQLSPDLTMLLVEDFGLFGVGLYDLTAAETREWRRISDSFPYLRVWAPDSSWILLMEDDQFLNPELTAYMVATGETVTLHLEATGLQAAAVVPRDSVPAFAD